MGRGAGSTPPAENDFSDFLVDRMPLSVMFKSIFNVLSAYIG